jgi:hypothetical protein
MKKNQNGFKFLLGILFFIMLVGWIIKKLNLEDLLTELQDDNVKRGRQTKDAKKTIMARVSQQSDLSGRQQKILSIFAPEKKVYMENIVNAVKGVHVRTLRRELSKLESKKLIKKVGKTKGSYYIKS